MKISDETLRRFCLAMMLCKKTIMEENSRITEYELAQSMLMAMNSLFIHNSCELSKLSDDEKRELFEVLQLYVPAVRRPRGNDNVVTYSSHCHHDYYGLIWVPHCHSGYSYSGHCGGGSGCCHGGVESLEDLIAFVVICLVLIASYVLYHECLDIAINLGAILNDEGQAWAVCNLILIGALNAIFASLAFTVISAAIAFSQPVVIVSLVAAAITVIGSCGVYWVISQIVDAYTAKSQLVNPTNPYKNFTMTNGEAAKLEANGTSALKAKAAIILLQNEITSNASLMDSHNQAILSQIRQLRFGKDTKVTLSGRQELDCSKLSNSVLLDSATPPDTLSRDQACIPWANAYLILSANDDTPTVEALSVYSQI